MGERDLRGGRGTQRGGDAGHHVHRHTGGMAGFRLLAAASEHEGIAALEANDIMSRQSFPHEQGVDLFLLHRVPRAAFGHGDQASRGLRHGQDRRIDQSVVHDERGIHQQPGGAQRQEIGVSGTGADQMDSADRGGIRLHGGADDPPRLRLPAIMALRRAREALAPFAGTVRRTPRPWFPAPCPGIPT